MKILLILYSLRRSWSSICLKNVRFIDVAAIPLGVKIELLPVPRKYSKHIWKGGIRHSRVSKGLSHDELYSAVIPNKNTECDIFSVETMGEIFVRICILDLWSWCVIDMQYYLLSFFSPKVFPARGWCIPPRAYLAPSFVTGLHAEQSRAGLYISRHLFLREHIFRNPSNSPANKGQLQWPDSWAGHNEWPGPSSWPALMITFG